MVIDDSEPNRRATVAVLERSGHGVVAAAGGEDALRVLQHARPDVVVLDLLMPGVDGWEVLTRLKSAAAGPLADVPVIVLTGVATVENSTLARFAGAVACLSKPVTPARLLDEVDRALHTGAEHQKRRHAQFDALRELARHQTRATHRLSAAEPAPRSRPSGAIVALTDRQHEVVDALSRHATMRGAARELLMSDSRISAVLRRIAWKLDMPPSELLASLRRRDPDVLRSLRRTHQPV